MIPSQVSESQDVHCRDPVHLEACDWYTAEIMGAVQERAENSVPIPQGGENLKEKVIPGFDAQVKTFKDTAHFGMQYGSQQACH